MTIHTSYITDNKGTPLSVVIPINEFERLVEEYGIDLSKEEKNSIEKNKKLRASRPGKIDNEYTDLSKL